MRNNIKNKELSALQNMALPKHNTQSILAGGGTGGGNGNGSGDDGGQAPPPVN